MRVDKKDINSIMNLLEISIKNCNKFKEVISSVNEIIPLIDSINGDKEVLSIKTNLIYNIHKTYMKDIRSLGIDINDVKTTYIEFVINNCLNDIMIFCNLCHVLDDKEVKLSLSKKKIKHNVIKAVI